MDSEPQISSRKRGVSTNKETSKNSNGSITNAKGSKPFWNSYTWEISRQMWCPTDCVATNPAKLGQNSWFTVKMWKPQEYSPKETFPLWPQQLQEPQTEERPTKKMKKKGLPPAEKAKRIRLFPNERQRDILKQWLGTARWTFNRCLQAVKNETPRKKKTLRAVAINSENFEKENQWVLNTPYDIRDAAMADLLKAFKTCFALKRKGIQRRFDIKYRSKKSETSSITIHSKHWMSKGVFYPTFFGKEPLLASEPLPDKLKYDSRIIRTKLGEYYLCISLPLSIRSENQAPQWKTEEEGILAIDPGVRTFGTTYSPEGLCVEWGEKDIGRIYRLCHAMDGLQSRWSKKGVRHRKRYKLKRAARRIRKKVRNLVDEMHKKFVKWIVSHHRVVLLPEFRTQRMVQRGKRRIRSKTAKAMLTWAHYRFKVRLLQKTREYPWCKVILCDEDYTSKTCGCCGFLHWKLGSNKNFQCPRCKVELDRDMNAARNILLRFLTLRVGS